MPGFGWASCLLLEHAGIAALGEGGTALAVMLRAVDVRFTAGAHQRTPLLTCEQSTAAACSGRAICPHERQRLPAISGLYQIRVAQNAQIPHCSTQQNQAFTAAATLCQITADFCHGVCNIQIVRKDEQNQEADLMIEIVIGLLAAAWLPHSAPWRWSHYFCWSQCF
jgi:hypothetical protein